MQLLGIRSSKRRFITSILYSLYFTCNSLTLVLGEIEGLVLLSFVLIFLIVTTMNLKHVLYMFPKYSLLMILLLFYFGVSFLIGRESVVSHTFLSFIVFGCPLLFAPYKNIDFALVIKSIALQGIAVLPFYLTFEYGYGDFAGDELSEGITMTLSYRMLPFIASSIIVAISKNLNKVLRVLVAFEAILFLALLLLIGSRGAQLSIIVFFFLLFIINVSDYKKRNRRIRLVLLTVVILVVLFVPILYALSNLLDKYDIDVLAIARMVHKLNIGDSLDSDRGMLIHKALNEFCSSPIFGNGISSFDNYSGYYPHNLFIQMIGEGGVIFGALFVILMVKVIKTIFSLRPYNNIYAVFVLFVFCSGVIRLFFSSIYWESQFFWAMVSLVFASSQIRNNIVEKEL